MKNIIILITTPVFVLTIITTVFAQQTPVAKHELRVAQKQAIENKTDDNFLKFYSDFKKDLNEKLGFQFGLDISSMPQRLSPSGKQTSIQNVYYPYITWNIFKDSKFGSGQINFNYTITKYWGPQQAVLQGRGSTAVAINDYESDGKTFSQLSYTHTLPGKMDWLSVTIGQFPIYNFDGTTYLNNQQTSLINYSLSQNASSVYPSGSLGAYIQASLKNNITVSAGYQDASNITGEKIEFDTAFDGDYTGFASIYYSPMVKGLGKGNYGLIVYHQPSTELQPGSSWGYSLNLEQNLDDKWVVFASGNGISRQVASVKQSYRAGVSYLNPLNRNNLDVITLAAAYNILSKEQFNAADIDSAESVLEAQWVWGFSKWITLTPDIQMYPRAALDSSKKWITVASLRATLMF